MAKSAMPEIGEVVVCRISKILDYGVFVEMQEYEGLNGFVHISQVASSWVKNIRNFVKEGQVRAAEVLHIDFEKKHVDLSFTKVSSGTQKAKIDAWNHSKRNQKLLEILASENKANFEIVWKEIAEPLMQNYGSLQEAFQEISLKGNAAASGIPEKWQKTLVELLQKNIEIPKRTVRGILSISCSMPDGVEKIKEALIKARNFSKAASIEMNYIGSGKWDLRVSSIDFKLSEKMLNAVSEKAMELMKAFGGTAGFEKAG